MLPTRRGSTLLFLLLDNTTILSKAPAFRSFYLLRLLPFSINSQDSSASLSEMRILLRRGKAFCIQIGTLLLLLVVALLSRVHADVFGLHNIYNILKEIIEDKFNTVSLLQNNLLKSVLFCEKN